MRLLGKRTFQIVGVVGDVKQNDLRSAIRPELYLPVERLSASSVALVVRTAADAASLLPSIQRSFWSVDNAIPANPGGARRLCTIRLTCACSHHGDAPRGLCRRCAALGLVGVYGVLSYAVSQRTREIGIRLALGASQRDTLRMVLGEAFGPAAIGAAGGILGALALSRYMSALLYGVSPSDPATHITVVIVAPLMAVAEAYYPARRAARLDHSVTLRAE